MMFDLPAKTRSAFELLRDIAYKSSRSFGSYTRCISALIPGMVGSRRLVERSESECRESSQQAGSLLYV
jgi:hypothetical protein